MTVRARPTKTKGDKCELSRYVDEGLDCLGARYTEVRAKLEMARESLGAISSAEDYKVIAVFTSARHAIEAALACAKAGDEAALHLHLGLHAGDVIREDNNVYGGAVNIASRISGVSAPGEVLVSDIVRGLARTSAGVRFEDRGEQSLKGVGEAVRGWAGRGAE